MMPDDKHYYYCYSKDVDVDDAMAHFRDKFKTDATESFHYKNLLWLGPVGEAPERQLDSTWKDKQR